MDQWINGSGLSWWSQCNLFHHYLQENKCLIQEKLQEMDAICGYHQMYENWKNYLTNTLWECPFFSSGVLDRKTAQKMSTTRQTIKKNVWRREAWRHGQDFLGDHWTAHDSWRRTAEFPWIFFYLKKRKEKSGGIWKILEEFGMWRKGGNDQWLCQGTACLEQFVLERVAMISPESSRILQNLTELSRNLLNLPESYRIVQKPPESSRIIQIHPSLILQNLQNLPISSRILQKPS